MENILHVSSKYGQKYQCVMPVKDVKKPNSNEQDDKSKINDTVTSILDSSLNGQCLLYVSLS